MGKSVVSAVLVTKIVTRTVMRLWAIGGGGGGGQEAGAISTADEMYVVVGEQVDQAVPDAKNRRERRKRVVAQRFQNPLKGAGRAGTGAGAGGDGRRPGAAPHRRVLYAGSESGSGPGHSRGWGWGSCGHICGR